MNPHALRHCLLPQSSVSADFTAGAFSKPRGLVASWLQEVRPPGHYRRTLTDVQLSFAQVSGLFKSTHSFRMRYVVLSVNRVAPRGGDYIATHGALGEIRTPGTRFRKPLLFPLSYGGGVQDAGFMQIFSGRYSGICNHHYIFGECLLDASFCFVMNNVKYSVESVNKTLIYIILFSKTAEIREGSRFCCFCNIIIMVI